MQTNRETIAMGATSMTAAQAIERAKREILEDVATGIVPADAPDFSALHSYVDANEYGGLCEDWAFLPYETADGGYDAEGSAAFLNEVQYAVDAWIKSGGLR